MWTNVYHLDLIYKRHEQWRKPFLKPASHGYLITFQGKLSTLANVPNTGQTRKCVRCMMGCIACPLLPKCVLQLICHSPVLPKSQKADKPLGRTFADQQPFEMQRSSAICQYSTVHTFRAQSQGPMLG